MLDIIALASKADDADTKSQKKKISKPDSGGGTTTIRLRGKERERPKAKRLTRLKRIVIEERRNKRHQNQKLMQLQALLHSPYVQWLCGASDCKIDATSSAENDFKKAKDNIVVLDPIPDLAEKKQVKETDWLTTDEEDEEDVQKTVEKQEVATTERDD